MECIRSEINELKQSLQDQLLMDSLQNDCTMKEKRIILQIKRAKSWVERFLPISVGIMYWLCYF